MTDRRSAQRVSRERLEELARLGPWDLEKDWEPTPEMRARQRLPFWSSEDPEIQKSVTELYSAFRLRIGVVAYKTFDPARQGGSTIGQLPAGDAAAYERFRAWLLEMDAAGQRHYVPVVHDTLIHERPCLDQRRFLAAIALHVEIRKRDTAGKPLLSSPADRLRRAAEDERNRVVRIRR